MKRPDTIMRAIVRILRSRNREQREYYRRELGKQIVYGEPFSADARQFFRKVLGGILPAWLRGTRDPPPAIRKSLATWLPWSIHAPSGRPRISVLECIGPMERYRELIDQGKSHAKALEDIATEISANSSPEVVVENRTILRKLRRLQHKKNGGK